MKTLKILVLFIFISFVPKIAHSEIEYVVKSGDSLTDLAKKFGVSPQEIVAANPQNKFVKVCIDEKNHVTKTGKEITLCRRVAYWLKVGRIIVIPDAVKDKMQELEKENKKLRAANEKLQSENEELQNQLIQAKDEYKKLQNQKHVENLSRFENSIVQRIWEKNLFLALFLFVFFVLFLISILVFYYRPRQKVVNNLNLSESIKRAQTDLIRERQLFQKDREATEQKIKEKTEELKEKESILNEKEKELKSKEENLKIKEEQISAREKELAQKEKVLKEEQENVRNKENKFSAQQKEIEKHEIELAQREEKLREEEKEFAVKFASLKEREQRVKEQEVNIQKIYVELDKKRETLEKREKDLEKKEQEIEQKKQTLNALQEFEVGDDLESPTLEIKVRESKEDKKEEKKQSSGPGDSEIIDLTAHVTTESMAKKFHCPECDEAIPLSELDEHMLKKHSGIK